MTDELNLTDLEPTLESEQELQTFEKQNLTIAAQAQAIEVNSQEENKTANNLLGIVAAMKRNITAYWKTPIDKANKAHKELTRKRNEMLAPVVEVEKKLRGKISQYLLALEQERIKKQQELQKLADKAKKKGEFVPQVKIETPKTEGQVTRESWYAEVIDKKAVPEEYKIVDIQTLNKLATVMKGKAKVKGVKFLKRISVVVR